jgi:hypothetical protein
VCEEVGWLQLARVRILRLVFASTAVNLRVLQGVQLKLELKSTAILTPVHILT